ncbi:MAG: hypothetical protein IJV14_04120 [Lachnospiraceae bacterium]|nr:hypothetical protein [Lachnospiraceae bacterium]
MTSGSSERYLSKFRLTRGTIKKHILLITGAFLTIFFGIAFILCLNDEELAEDGGLALSVTFLVMGVFFLYRGFLCSARIIAARQYSVVFDYDQNGIVTLQEIASHTGKTEEKVTRELNWLFRRNIFSGCHFQRQDPPCVILSGAWGVSDSDEDMPQFKAVTCPHCMAVVRIREGSTVKCEYCGSDVSAS